MKKVISYSLYGSDAKYTTGMICNAAIAKILFPDWVCRVYYGDSVPNDILIRLKEFDNLELVRMEEDGEHSYMMWRFLAIDDDSVDVMLSRDADSRLSIREKTCVDIFINSDFGFHSIRDNTNHNNVMGGMWGIKKGCLKNKMSYFIENHHKGLDYGLDQNLIREISQKGLNCDILVHSSQHPANFPNIDYNQYKDIFDNQENSSNFFIGYIFSPYHGDKPGLIYF